MMDIKICLPQFGDEFIAETKKFSTLKTFSNNEYVINQGQSVNHLPIVLNGLVKVQSQEVS